MNAPETKKSKKRERLSKQAKIVIVGSGLGGLSAAISLREAGFEDVIVVERDVCGICARREGYGLTLTYNPKGPLASPLGILEEVCQRDCPSRCHYVFRPSGQIMGYYGNAFASSSGTAYIDGEPKRGCGQRGNLRIPRQELRELLFQKLERRNSPVLFGKKVVNCVQSTDRDNTTWTLLFADGTTHDQIDLLVAADGIRSTILDEILGQKSLIEPACLLRYLGVMVVLGIADNFVHPLADERGFYTLDGTHRLFTMPFQGTAIDGKQRRIMWQLSFPQADQQQAIQWAKKNGTDELRHFVLEKVKGWHEPVQALIMASPLSSIWCTGLMDRDPTKLVQALINQHEKVQPRLAFVGDAAHPMSPFKGQGANQALMDGPLLASWLCRASTDAAIRGYHREMVQRAGPKVHASREAAGHLHSPAVLQTHEFAGVRKDSLQTFLRQLQEQNVTASCGVHLDERIRSVVNCMGVARYHSRAVSRELSSAERIDRTVQSLALQAAAKGETDELRSLSWKDSESVRTAREGRTGYSCLHLAVMNGKYTASKFLLTEAFLSPLLSTSDHGSNSSDKSGITPLEIARHRGNSDIISLLESSLSYFQMNQQRDGEKL